MYSNLVQLRRVPPYKLIVFQIKSKRNKSTLSFRCGKEGTHLDLSLKGGQKKPNKL